MTNKKTLGIVGLVVLAVVAMALIYRDQRASKIEITGNIEDALQDSGISMTGDGKIEVIPIEEVKLPPAPTLVRSTDFKNNYPAEAQKAILANLEKAITEVKKNPGNMMTWVDLGIQRKEIGDYEGARDVWEYAKALEPNNIIPWNNLGDLYHFYLKDYVKSELNWKKTIALKPDYAQGYRGLYELYTYSMKDKMGEIPALLKKGIAYVPEATDLKVLLEEYEKLAGTGNN